MHIFNNDTIKGFFEFSFIEAKCIDKLKLDSLKRKHANYVDECMIYDVLAYCRPLLEASLAVSLKTAGFGNLLEIFTTRLQNPLVPTETG